MSGRPRAYTLYPELIDAQKGNRARIHLRRYDREKERWVSETIETELDAFFPSKPAGRDLIPAVREANETWREVPGIDFLLRRTRGGGLVTQAFVKDRSLKTKKELRRLGKEAGLGVDYFHTRFSPSVAARVNYRSFVEPFDYWHDGRSGWVRKDYIEPSLEEMLAAVKDDIHCFIDIETEGWDVPGEEERISGVVIGTNKPELDKYILTRYDPHAEAIGGYRIKVFKDHEELQEQLLEIILREYDPLTIVGYNLQFDLKRLREWLPKFAPSTDDREPKVHSASGQSVSMQIGGRQVIDLYNKFKEEMTFLKNQKLGTIMQYFGYDFVKGLNYYQLAQRFKNAEEHPNDPDALHDLEEALQYTAADGDATLELYMDQIDEVFIDAIICGTRPERTCKSFSAVGDEYWIIDHLEKEGTLPTMIQKHYQRLRPDLEQRRFFGLDLKITLGPVARRNWTEKIPWSEMFDRQDGQYQEAAIFYPTLLLQAMEPLYQAHPRLKELWHYYRGSEHRGKRVRGLRKLQELMAIPFMQYLAFCEWKKLDPTEHIALDQLDEQQRNKIIEIDQRYKRTWGNQQCGFLDINQHLSRVAHAWQDAVGDLEWLINFDNHFLVVTPEAADRLDRLRLGMHVARGPAISVGKKCFLWDHDTVYTIGAQLTGGDKTKFEQNLIYDLLRGGLHQIRNTGRTLGDDLGKLVKRRFKRIQMEDRTELVCTRTLSAKRELEWRQEQRKAPPTGGLFDDQQPDPIEYTPRIPLRGVPDARIDKGSNQYDPRWCKWRHGFVEGLGPEQREWGLEVHAFLEDERPVDTHWYYALFRKHYKEILGALGVVA